MPDSALTPDQFLSGDMKPADIVAALEDLTFRRTRSWQREPPCRLLSIDVEVRNFLVASILQRISAGLKCEHFEECGDKESAR
jgi:hypothetical protein